MTQPDLYAYLLIHINKPPPPQTTNPNIYAAGDCIGYPALASTSMEQGRRASCHMWGDMLGIPEQPKVGVSSACVWGT